VKGFHLSFLRYYDEAVVNYFNDIKIEDGDTLRSPQVLLGTPSRQGVKLNVTNDNTAVLPLISVIRTGLSATSETNLVKSHVTRPNLYNINSTETYFEGAELMPYNFSYQIDFFSLVQDMHNEIVEQMLFKVHKKHYIKVKIDVVNHNIETNLYIHNISFNDSTSYTQIADTASRIFHGTLNFNLYGFLIDIKRNTPTVLREEYSINPLNSGN
jgi:hypothetical protein